MHCSLHRPRIISICTALQYHVVMILFNLLEHQNEPNLIEEHANIRANSQPPNVFEHFPTPNTYNIY